MKRFKKDDVVRLRKRGIVREVTGDRVTVQWDREDDIGPECLELVKRPRDMFWVIVTTVIISLAAVARVIIFVVTGS